MCIRDSYSSASTSRYKGSFTATASVRNEVTDSAITEIINEINLISSEGVTDEELDAAKEKYVGSFIMSTEQPSTIANFATNIAKFNLPENFYEKYLVLYRLDRSFNFDFCVSKDTENRN